jgi:hypothetical protein
MQEEESVVKQCPPLLGLGGRDPEEPRDRVVEEGPVGQTNQVGQQEDPVGLLAQLPETWVHQS